MDIEEGTFKNIERALGRRLVDDERGNVDNFSSFTERDISEISVLGKSSLILVVSYIMFRLKDGASLRSSKSYYSSVIDQGIPMHEWLEELD